MTCNRATTTRRAASSWRGQRGADRCDAGLLPLYNSWDSCVSWDSYIVRMLPALSQLWQLGQLWFRTASFFITVVTQSCSLLDPSCDSCDAGPPTTAPWWQVPPQSVCFAAHSRLDTSQLPTTRSLHFSDRQSRELESPESAWSVPQLHS